MPGINLNYKPNCDVFLTASCPSKDPLKACRRILRDENILLHWPQLPKRSSKERPIDQTCLAIQNRDGSFPRGVASGWSTIWRNLKGTRRALRSKFFKTQIMGPITLFGKLKLTSDQTEAGLRHYVNLWLKHAFWQIDQIQDQGFTPILVLDEPLLPTYMGLSGSAQHRRTIKLLRSLVKRLRKRGALIGIHCCNRVSPAVLIDTDADLVHFDAHHFPSQVAQARQKIQGFLKEGGIIAWGIIPSAETLTPAAQAKVGKNFTALLSTIELPLKKVLSQSMISTTCGTETLTQDQSDKAMGFASELAQEFKSRYRL